MLLSVHFLLLDTEAGLKKNLSCNFIREVHKSLVAQEKEIFSCFHWSLALMNLPHKVATLVLKNRPQGALNNLLPSSSKYPWGVASSNNGNNKCYITSSAST